MRCGVAKPSAVQSSAVAAAGLFNFGYLSQQRSSHSVTLACRRRLSLSLCMCIYLSRCSLFLSIVCSLQIGAAGRADEMRVLQPPAQHELVQYESGEEGKREEGETSTQCTLGEKQCSPECLSLSLSLSHTHSLSLCPSLGRGQRSAPPHHAARAGQSVLLLSRSGRLIAIAKIPKNLGKWARNTPARIGFPPAAGEIKEMALSILMARSNHGRSAILATLSPSERSQVSDP